MKGNLQIRKFISAGADKGCKRLLSGSVRTFCGICAFLAAFLLIPLQARADEAAAHFGSASYQHYEGQEFSIGLYITAQRPVGEYSLTVAYDAQTLEYISGAQAGGDGTLTISGSTQETEVKVMVRFRALASGSSVLEITEAQAAGIPERIPVERDEDPNGDADEETEEGEAGEATEEEEQWELVWPEPFTMTYQEPAPMNIAVDRPLYLSGIEIGGESLPGFSTQKTEYELTVPYETESLDITVQGGDARISDTGLAVGENTITLTLISPGGIETVYTLHVTRQEEVLSEEGEAGGDSAQEENASENASEDASEDVSEDVSADSEENGAEADFDKSHVRKEIVQPIDRGGMLFRFLAQKAILIPLLVLVLVVVGISSLVTFFEYQMERDRLRRQKRREAEEEKSAVDLLDLDSAAPEAAPVIVVDDVSMEFRVATQNVSGLKEWVIEKIRGKISYRTLRALDHIQFEVYPGEVVGIIGTNGSGKSTLLKIVSGALKPTSGRIIADRSKIQLLTLGTGFDMELTARENVYLNGAIIGYTREFLDEHYEEIVAFAELENFMEEKVKKFSSGMVSRLGFAIATAGKTAEILILDEVLAVGDEFFRKKSLKRIKEMIHGGSTVLLVSHSMETIRQNCSIVIWIEKGKLKMMGDAKEVCKAYQSMGL